MKLKPTVFPTIFNSENDISLALSYKDLSTWPLEEKEFQENK